MQAPYLQWLLWWFFSPCQQACELQCASGKAVRLIHNLESVTAAQCAWRLPLENHPVGGGGKQASAVWANKALQKPLSIQEYIIGLRSKTCTASAMGNDHTLRSSVWRWGRRGMPTIQEGLCSFLKVLNNQLMTTCFGFQSWGGGGRNTSCCYPWWNLADTKWLHARLQHSSNRRKRTS